MSSTEFNYTGQRKDVGTGLLFYNARYYDPALGRFLQADSLVPGTSHRALTVDFHEMGFGARLAGENTQGFWFQMSGRQRHQATPPWGPGNPQELNRYSYVNNNPLRYTDPSGHITMTREQAGQLAEQIGRLVQLINEKIRSVADPADLLTVLKSSLLEFIGNLKGTVGAWVAKIAGYAYDALVTYNTIAALTGFSTFLLDIQRGLIRAAGSNSSYVFMEFSSLGGGCGGSDTTCEFAGGATLGIYWSTGSYVVDDAMASQALLDAFYVANVDWIGDCRRSNQTSCADPNTPNPKPEKGVPSGPLSMNH